MPRTHERLSPEPAGCLTSNSHQNDRTGDVVSPLARSREPFGRQRTAGVNSRGPMLRQEAASVTGGH